MKFLTNARLGKKIGLASAGMVLMLLSTLVLSVWTMGRIQSAVDQSQAEALRTSAAQDAHMRITKVVLRLGDILVHEQGAGSEAGAHRCSTCHEDREKSELLAPMLKERDAYLKDFTELEGTAKSDQDRRLLEAVEQATAELRNADNKILDQWKSGKVQQAWMQFDTQSVPAIAKADQALANIVEHQRLEMAALAAATGSTMSSVRLSLILAGVLMAIITMPAATLLARDVTRPVAAVIEQLGKVARGDVSDDVRRDLVERRDEAGELAGATQKLITSLRPIIQEVTQGVQTLSASSTELSAVSRDMSAGSQKTSERAGAVANSAEQMSGTMAALASAMEQASSSLTAVAAATEQMTATIGEIAANSEKARHITGDATRQAGQVSELMNELGRAAQRIGEVTETISNISAQTNLLALNATIEAARAGAAGKGFAVVANEIKDLASQTAAATEDIKGKVSGIQTSTAATIADIGKISGTIREVSDIVSSIATAIEQQAAVTKDIAGNIAQASVGVKGATTQVTQSSEVSTQIAGAIETVNRAAGEAANGSAQVQSGAEELSKLAEQLRHSVEQFTL